MEFEKIGVLAVDNVKLRRWFPDMKPGKRAAVGDISLANGLSVVPYVPEAPLNLRRGRPHPTILNIAEILSA
jgi:hypothetical protein